MKRSPRPPLSPPRCAIELLRRLRSSLVTRVSLIIGGFGAAIALGFGVVTATLMAEFELKRHLAHTEDLLGTVERTVQIACFTGEGTLATEVAKGLMTNPSIAAVRIVSDDFTLAEMRRPSSLEHATHEVRRKVYSPFDAGQPVGEIVIEADTDFIVAQAEEHSSLFSAFLMLEAIVVTVIVALLILRVVVRPIACFAGELHQFDGGTRTCLSPPRGHEANEIGRLAAAFNRMIDSLAGLLDKERAMSEKVARSEQRFRTLAENSPDIILRYDSDLRPIFANPAYLREIEAARRVEEDDAWLPTMPREQFLARLGMVVGTGVSDRMQWEWRSASGQAIHYEMYVVAEYDSDRGIIGALVIGRNISERKEIERQLVHQATHDVLTGLPNRALLKDRLQHAIARAQRDEEIVALVFIDLDHFKDINDSLGHDAGDELLKAVAARLLAESRDSDTVARLGGDEFVVVLEGCADRLYLEATVQRLHDAVGRACQVGGHRVFPAASVGIAVFPEDGTDVDVLMRSADTAMYVAKGEGRNHYRFFSAEMNEALREWMKLSTDLHCAIENGEFALHFQPKVRATDHEPVGMEALVRWNHPELGLIPPVRFIPVAEKCGLIGPIGEWVLGEACRQTRAWLDQGLDPGRVAVNLSAAQCEGPLLPLQIRRALDAHGLSGAHLEVEITESIAMADAEESIRAFWALRDMGVQIAVDDFGTGYSSLSYLKRLPVDVLKIDRSFVQDIESDANDREIIRAITAMAHSLGLRVVAEGVETLPQLEFLHGVGCDQLQGYFFSRPIPADAMTAALRGRGRTAAAALPPMRQHPAMAGRESTRGPRIREERVGSPQDGSGTP